MYNSSIIFLFFHVRKVQYLCDENKVSSFIKCLSLLIYIYLILLKYWKKLKVASKLGTPKLVKKLNQNLQEPEILINLKLSLTKN